MAREGLPRPGQDKPIGASSPGVDRTTPAPAASTPAAAAAASGPTPTAEQPGSVPSSSESATTAPETAPAVVARAPHLLPRLPAGRVPRILLLAVAVVVVAAIVVLAARWLVSLQTVKDFTRTYPGETDSPQGSPVGFPAWLAWQHFFNVFFLALIVKTGWQVRTQKRPPAYWTPRWSPGGRKISLTLWLHQSLDLLWLINGVVFVVVLFATNQWLRIVPTSWDVVPNALSAALQYASLDWPTENGWVNYNSLQLLTYFVTVFIAAPLAVLTGVRMSELWPARVRALSRAYPIDVARAIHLPVMFYFVAFTIAHVTLVLATGALRNLNHMYGGQDAVNWLGFAIFAASLFVIVGAWFAARPLVVAPIASLFGNVGR